MIEFLLATLLVCLIVASIAVALTFIGILVAACWTMFWFIRNYPY